MQQIKRRRYAKNNNGLLLEEVHLFVQDKVGFSIPEEEGLWKTVYVSNPLYDPASLEKNQYPLDAALNPSYSLLASKTEFNAESIELRSKIPSVKEETRKYTAEQESFLADYYGTDFLSDPKNLQWFTIVYGFNPLEP
jgi:hypothetical protein